MSALSPPLTEIPLDVRRQPRIPRHLRVEILMNARIETRSEPRLPSYTMAIARIQKSFWYRNPGIWRSGRDIVKFLSRAAVRSIALTAPRRRFSSGGGPYIVGLAFARSIIQGGLHLENDRAERDWHHGWSACSTPRHVLVFVLAGDRRACDGLFKRRSLVTQSARAGASCRYVSTESKPP